ncbi:hypothetical protein FRACA_390013 [Frankia canadensis]|uniref:Uncharacterized protein n=1 Tax=Frankia canadensis TaxID=1836972 RepID=A0A2I2KW59_9ACTN|nr:hypothetical protein [Frankia canadensis]SNQ49899.1 hypothetical protein FRACA_390013 [Frankia canadensis]SOU57189.1 hypothetical protein FRACA_390013 [Frankia canadensis]
MGRFSGRVRFGARVRLFVPPGFDTTPIDVALERLPALFDVSRWSIPTATDTAAGHITRWK